MLATSAERERFLREASLLARLRHPAIVAHVASGESPDGRFYLAMESLEGEDLAARLARKSLSAGESLSLARRAAEALEAAHALGIVHRDVKPSNLFLSGGDIDRLTLIDFGIARGDRHLSPLTATGTFIGTIGYAAPEHANGVADIDARADIYSLGCVLFECLTGRRALAGETPLQVLAEIDARGRARHPRCAPDVPAAIAALVARMVASSRTDRFSDATSVIAAIVEIEQRKTSMMPPPPRRDRLVGEQRLASLILLMSPDMATATSATMTAPAMEEQEKRARVAVERAGHALGSSNAYVRPEIASSRKGWSRP